MDEPILLTPVEPAPEGGQRVLAPKVGLWSDLPPAGALLGPGSRVGRLQQLNRRYRLVLPEGAAGQIVDGLPQRRVVAVEYGQLLFRLRPVGDALALGPGPRSGLPQGEEVPAGARAVVSPTDGVFYARPSPEDPPFVAVGQTIQRGQAVGLVEVMKTFNRILYDGPELPDAAQVLEVRVEDGAEVRAGQVLVVVG